MQSSMAEAKSDPLMAGFGSDRIPKRWRRFALSAHSKIGCLMLGVFGRLFLFLILGIGV